MPDSQEKTKTTSNVVVIHTTVDRVAGLMLNELVAHHGQKAGQILRSAIREYYRKTFPGRSDPEVQPDKE